ncbi:MAG: bifunctional 4-hydroxy-2-oxoglutarate aldolase/2-dehydro-3-deoxy-phosphogluconate aldolase [Leptospirales bacterium]|nr:bifunctional 4-hydroxy-2-oxoglutarate aldolase/2-dehydro-3-deoxy-phosphogluconate aldolase [Leptospirales bacterium]
MIKDLLGNIKCIPVCVFEDIESALKITELLLKYDVNVIEVTLRTEKAFDCIKAIKTEFKNSIVGAGSVLKTSDFGKASDCGAVFAVSPCFDESLCNEAESSNIPYIPGAATPSEIYKALKYSNMVKIFPAALLGGVEYIKAVTAPFKMFDFGLMPTGGIDNNNYKEYIKIEKVTACGLTYPVNENLVKEKNFDEIEHRIKEIYGVSA